MEKRPVIFCDMEGTLFEKTAITVEGRVAPSAWSAIAKELGEACLQEEEAGRRKWNEGGFAGYVEWMGNTIGIYQRHGLTRAMFERILGSMNYHRNVIEVFNVFRQRYRTALISGGFKAQADRALCDLKMDHAYAACELFWDPNGSLYHWNLLPCDYEGKADFMRLIIREHGLDPKDCFFIGDGYNDISLARTVGTSIAFNGHPGLQEACTHVINQPTGQEDFAEVLKYIPH